MNRTNGLRKFIAVDSTLRAQLQAWGARVTRGGQEVSLLDLCSKDYLLITVLIWLNWGTVSFIYYGIVVNLPTSMARLEEAAGVSPGSHSTLYLMLSSLS